MKTIKILTMILSVSILMASCSKTNAEDPAPAQQTKDSLKQGDWKVTYYEERGKDETSKFSGYTLTFNDDGTLILKNGTQSFSGTWAFENHSDDSSSQYQKLVIWITGNKTADELQDDWYLIETTTDMIRMQDDNSSHTEILEIRRI